MKDYMNFFLDEEQVISASDQLDVGIEYAYMLQKEDLDYLLEVWDQYSEEWKSGICFFAGCAPLEDSLNLLIHGLNDSHEEIKFQALCSILQSAEEELEDFGNLPSILNPLLIKRLISEVMHSSQQHLLEEDFPEVLPELRKKSQNFN
jgi:hypothetical protein